MIIAYFLRHATAEPQGSALADFDRSLTSQGQSEAAAVAEYLKSKGLTFDYVMCSSALRAQQTLEPLRAVVGTTDIEISKAFYNVSEERILEALHRLSDDHQKILYIGHNPGVAFSILRLSQSIPKVLEEGIIPATLVGFEFPEESWSTLAWQTGKLMDVFKPSLPSTAPAPEGS